MTAAIFSLIGLAAGYGMVIMIDRLIAKKSLQHGVNDTGGWLSTRNAVLLIITLNGIGWGLAGFRTDNVLEAVLVSVLFSLALMVAVIDFRIYIIPNELVLALMITGVIFQLVFFGAKSLIIAAGCMIAVMVVFVGLAAILGFGQVGAGDVKLAGAMGMVLGYPHILTGILAMCLVMGAYIIIGLSTFRLTKKSKFAYGPYMMIGLIAALISIVANIRIVG